MSEYLPTIGLEIHAELKTKTKMFCNSLNNPDEEKPNVNICPICMAHPGTLPVINKAAVKYIIKIGHSINGEIADYTEFDRKNYFYPDIPKGYQISQYKYPLVSGGELAGVSITRVHLEEDTARSTHDQHDEHSLLDFNRAGVPLMELVTEPVIHDKDTAVRFAKELQLLLRTLGVGEANMEKGQMRVEANISVGKDGKLGTKVEVKNLNSFRSVERAISYEIDRQIVLIDSGGKVVQETRGWDEGAQKTFSQRIKENSNDYRYFPDPDLPKLYISKIEEFSKENIKKEMPELPNEKRDRYFSLGLKSEDVEMLVSDFDLALFFDKTSNGEDSDFIKLCVNYLTSDIAGLLKGLSIKESKITPQGFKELIKMIKDGLVSSRGGKDILAVLFENGGDPNSIAKEKGLIQQNDEGALRLIVEELIKENPNVVQDFKNGKESALQFFVGQGMKKSKGSANPKVLMDIVKKSLN